MIATRVIVARPTALQTVAHLLQVLVQRSPAGVTPRIFTHEKDRHGSDRGKPRLTLEVVHNRIEFRHFHFHESLDAVEQTK